MSELMSARRGRIGRYLSIMVVVTLVAYVFRTAIGSMLARMGVETLAKWSTYVGMAVNVAAAIITASQNRRYTFRSDMPWGIAVPVMVVLEVIFDLLTGQLWSPVMRTLMQAELGLSGGYYLMLISYGFNIAQFAVWAVLAYLFQRYVLYRNTLDALLRKNIEE